MTEHSPKYTVLIEEAKGVHTIFVKIDESYISMRYFCKDQCFKIWRVGPKGIDAEVLTYVLKDVF